jgi:HAD superfamily hydrolase (TIGR01490 family)
MLHMPTTLVLFDFDGTLTRRDSLLDFLKYAVGSYNFYKGLVRLLPMLVAYGLRIISNNVAKERLIEHFLAGWDTARFETVADDYSKHCIDNILRPEAFARLKHHVASGHRVAIVSASMEDWLRAWCRFHRVELIATRLERDGPRLTGRFATKNCYGPEKVARVRVHFDLETFNEIYAYGDSSGDREMLALATKPFYRSFN